MLADADLVAMAIPLVTEDIATDLGLAMATSLPLPLPLPLSLPPLLPPPPFDPSSLGSLDWTMYSFMLPVSCLVAFLANSAGIGRHSLA